jgi:hypothetical protein
MERDFDRSRAMEAVYYNGMSLVRILKVYDSIIDPKPAILLEDFCSYIQSLQANSKIVIFQVSMVTNEMQKQCYVVPSIH